MLGRFIQKTACIQARAAAAKHAFPVTSQLRGHITYSGGQATEGQGGFYGSGGAHKITQDTEQRPEMLALAADVTKIQAVMQEVETLESLLDREKEESKGEITGRSIELRSSIKKLMVAPEFTECLNRLEIQGSPVWGLSSEERDLIHAAREKVNEC
uniref:Uncharacterized protein n=1 Tax=Odontella aurita TaxID=265563 RepID=A0A7S4K9H6_9STRA|mmetsp:Transcript_6937/g.20815  ORF Transcript_6937/g.20815 Transcript_6937/m.20815 type:complete len:157 (+) Transcript_6937:238-708(+)|eukprot:CAMPEP_0113547474 /NCGR_PEP_ID=MMETSP0015_2-20120614/12376_1 /TAXON_ID=2838 /ORGANISM="Odontella" /LENGTH=156 /DNA_ID=CAMNT_0000448033 /DNA_START=159 /DNA_END=629 /DNA_ORIENTATION=- /assembly_acc=CAM_ASM_000160